MYPLSPLRTRLCIVLYLTFAQCLVFENVRGEYITYHRIANKCVNKKGIIKLRSTSNMEICQSQYGVTTPQAWADPEGGGVQGVRTPMEHHKIYGFL